MSQSSNTNLRDALTDLTSESARELAAELAAEADTLQRRAAALTAYATALEAGSTEPHEHHSASTATAPPGPLGAPAAHGTPSRAKPAAPPSNKRPLIKEVIEENPTPGWTPERTHQVLVDRGLIPAETTKASIGVTLRRMYVKYKEIAKTRDGFYTTPEHGVMYDDSDEARSPFIDGADHESRGEGTLV